MRTSVMAALVLSGIFVALPAKGYRPFDGTDAAVAGPDETEIELGPFGYRRDGPVRYLVAPAIVANLGIAQRWELVAEGKLFFPFASAPDKHPALVDPALSLKTVLRRGSLQDASGPSVAAEFSALLATPDEPAVGASALLVVSQRWRVATAHVNLEAAFDRNRTMEGFGSVILEGPETWPARPVTEIYVDRAHVTELSALLGLIWPVGEHLSFDFAARLARADELEGELRAGMTFSFSVGRRPEAPSPRAGIRPVRVSGGRPW